MSRGPSTVLRDADFSSKLAFAGDRFSYRDEIRDRSTIPNEWADLSLASELSRLKKDLFQGVCRAGLLRKDSP